MADFGKAVGVYEIDRDCSFFSIWKLRLTIAHDTTARFSNLSTNVETVFPTDTHKRFAQMLVLLRELVHGANLTSDCSGLTKQLRTIQTSDTVEAYKATSSLEENVKSLSMTINP